MRKFRAIIQAEEEPEDIHVIWHHKGKLLYYENGDWITFDKVSPEDVKIKIDTLPGISNLKEVLDYLAIQAHNYRIVKNKGDLYLLKPGTFNEGTHCYVIDEDTEYIFSVENNTWVKKTDFKGRPFKIFASSVQVTSINYKTKIITFSEDIDKEIFVIAIDNNAKSVDDLGLCTVVKRDNTYTIIRHNKELPTKGQYVYIVGVVDDFIDIPIIQESDSVKNSYNITFYTNTIIRSSDTEIKDWECSIFVDSYDIYNYITVNDSRITNLELWKADIDSDQRTQNALIEVNKSHIEDVDRKIDAKVIEAGGVPFDLEPTKDSTNAVFSGGVYKYITDLAITTDKIEDAAVTTKKLSTDIQSLIANISKTATFAGIAIPTTNPGIPDGPVFYIATQAGSYSNFSNIEVLEGETVILKWNNDTWAKNAIKPMTDFNSVFDANGKPLNLRISTLQPYIANSSNDTIEGSIAEGVWYSKKLSFIVPLIPGKSLSITGNSKGVYYSILKTFPENIVIRETPDFATGYSDRVFIAANSTVTKTVPSDGEFLVIMHLGDTDAIPTSIIVNGIPYDIPINKKIATIEDSLKQSISELDNKDNFILNSLKDSVIWNKGYIDNNGNTKPLEGQYYTNLLPIVDGYGYEMWGADTTYVIFYYYSAPYIDAEHFLGKDITGELLSTAKYVSIAIASVEDIENVKVISNREITKLLINTPFKGLKSTTQFLYPETRINFLNFVLFAVKGFYFYGDSVNPDYDYTIGFSKLNSSLRVYITLEASTIIDKTITIPKDGIIDKTETVSGYNFRIIADCNNFADFNMLGLRQKLCFNKNAFSPIIGNPLALETSVKELNTLRADINDPDKIIINDGLGDIVDYIEYLTLEKGSTTGAILASTGSPIGNSFCTRTDYISLKGIYAVKVTTPKGSSAGLAFYTGNDVSKYTEQYINGVTYDTGGNGNTWIPVPNGARYFRTTVLNTDISGGTAVLQVHKYVTKNIQEYIDSVTEQLVPRATNVLFGYEWFLKGIKKDNDWSADTKYLEKSRNTYVVETEDENAKQMISDTQLYFNKMQIEAHFEVGSSDAFFGIGTIASGAVIQNEVRIHNVDGNAVFEVYSGVVTSGDTYGKQSPRVVISKTMSFALIAGNTYKLGMRKFENEAYDNVEHMDGVIYYVKSLSDDILYEEFVPRNSKVNNDIRNGITASCKGSIYVSVKKGTVTVDNIFVSSEYNPQAKVLLVGDSYSDGDTLIGTDATTGCGQKNKFACLLQSDIGDKSFVIAGKGGDGVFTSSIPYLKKEVKLFCPGYCILQYGANHGDFNIYKANMEEFTGWLDSLGIKPILVTTPPVTGRSIELITQMNDWVKNSGYRYVDMCKAVTVDGAGLVWKDGYVNSDGVHPTPLGHRAIYEAFVKELSELFAV